MFGKNGEKDKQVTGEDYLNDMLGAQVDTSYGLEFEDGAEVDSASSGVSDDGTISMFDNYLRNVDIDEEEDDEFKPEVKLDVKVNTKDEKKKPKKKGNGLKALRLGLGIFLILSAFGVLFTYKMWGVNEVEFRDVYVAKVQLEAGHLITKGDIAVKSVPVGTLVEGVISTKRKVVGERLGSRVVVGQMLSRNHLADSITEGLNLKEGQSIYKIPSDWVTHISTSVRAGDKVDIYNEKAEYLGSYQVIFSKDVNLVEVENLEVKTDDLIDRKQGTGIVATVEIIATVEDFKKLKDNVRYYVEETANGVVDKKDGLWIVQKLDTNLIFGDLSGVAGNGDGKEVSKQEVKKGAVSQADKDFVRELTPKVEEVKSEEKHKSIGDDVWPPNEVDENGNDKVN